MSEFIDLVRRRYSLRRYDPSRPVSRALLDECMEAARLAPSACNSQPWSFYIVDQPGQAADLARKACSGLYRMNKFTRDAPVMVALVREPSRIAARLGGHFRGMAYSMIDIGIAGQHLDLALAEAGLGCCWLGWFDEKAVIKALNLPRRSKVDILFSVGYPAENAVVPTKKRKSLDGMRHYVECK